jgi:hydrogenase maturation protease
MMKTLLVCIGNIGRGDDGLGWAFADRLVGHENLDIVYRYQLQIEDAELISHYQKVWFVDASHQPSPLGFECKDLGGEGHFSYTTHALHPAAVVQLCHQLYEHRPQAHLLGISGTVFGLGRELSETARDHLEKATHFFTEQLPSR